MCATVSHILSAKTVVRAVYAPSSRDVLVGLAHCVGPGVLSFRPIATTRLCRFANIDRRPADQSHAPMNTDYKLQVADRFAHLQRPFERSSAVQSLKEVDFVGSTLVGMFVALFGITFACVPLYEFFCQQSGYMGTTKRVKTYGPPPQDRSDRLFEIDFITHSQVNWDFKPAQRNVIVAPGETTLAFYTAKNLSDKPVIGVAAYHVIPDEAGLYFNKIQCFCFEEQMLNPGEEVDLPDKRLYDVDKITLTYTFFEATSEIPPEYTALLNRDVSNESKQP
ncbi:cytochrome c oxidase assembly protein Cox11 subunit [Babesia divergens]|uniref:Cytochrome c oxidase assembly protein Cox11 subunit n=1 Tax=Babesia divergens TaxID=32595 RepID=A0AAD9GFW7_BABDI|nr:cytochrome c oxidase assembly protein Cox11 subunit [Babesia divergens]